MKVSGMGISEFHPISAALDFFLLVLLSCSISLFFFVIFSMCCWLAVADGRCLSDWLSHSLSTSSLSISRKCLLSISKQPILDLIRCVFKSMLVSSTSSSFIVRWRHCCCLTDDYGNWSCNLFGSFSVRNCSLNLTFAEAKKLENVGDARRWNVSFPPSTQYFFLRSLSFSQFNISAFVDSFTRPMDTPTRAEIIGRRRHRTRSCC